MSKGAAWRVDTPLGPVLAHRDGDLWRARGIPYAEAARFERPSPVRPWRKPYDAATPAPVSPQAADGLTASISPDYTELLGIDERCQRVSVTWPDDAGDEPLPVVVWIHGGSFLTGAGDLEAYDPALLVREQRVVFVSVTYRLGLLGWFGDDDFAPANLGLLDILEALRWVRACVSSFGGDPTRITVMGQSAGGDAIAALLAVPEAQGLFRRAILQSAPLGIDDRRDGMHRTMRGVVAPVDPGMGLDEVYRAQEDIYRATKRHGLKGLMPFGPQWGRHPLPPESRRATETARASRVDLMVGHLSQEGIVVGAAIPAVGRAFRARVVGGSAQRAIAGPLQAVVYERPARAFVDAHRAAGGRAVHYVLGWKATGSPIADGHGMDMPVLLGDPDAWTQAPALVNESADRIRRVGAAVRQVWGDFARTGAVAPGSAAAASEWLRLS
ncbi:carboxylesterase family protein [Demequina salsinemoris]|uniref:carboxylesterase family protein n=1 Tax=Demequina salsinemoris TaxID=577470 RepID=UPI0007842855|nr:carboxylesterase family protein [Demequina salsinemoris]